MPVRSVEDYQVGWVCALPKELTAARVMLDEEHKDLPTRVPQDGNTYVLGRVHSHNVVIACLPAGVYGTNSAAVVATNMMRTFTNIRTCLLVGIGGGIPNLDQGVDIRLGDVVVSQPEKTHGGVVQYDLRKNVGAGVFERKGKLNQPPSFLLGAISRLQSNHHMNKDSVLEYIADMQQRFPELVHNGFSHPGPGLDVLHCSKPGVHDNEETGIRCDQGIMQREARADQRPKIHYGTIASGNELLKNAFERDRLGRELGAKCVEMEAAGLVNDFPCIVIRGICDYADYFKNDVWQEYAAVAASAYAKELLSVISPLLTRETNRIVSGAPRIPQRFPFPRNDDFVERRSIFSKLENLLSSDSPSQSAVLWGLGGAGKTQIALEFAYRRHISLNCPIFWIHASNYDKFVQGYRQIATDAGLSSTLQGSELLTAVCSWLGSQTEWLLVVDNADDLSLFGLYHQVAATDKRTDLLQFIPCIPHGTILWTTRDERAIGHLTGMSRGVDVRNMTNNEAKELLLGLSGKAEASDNTTTVSEIVDRLERLPLAISQAAAFIRARNISYNDYLLRLGQEHKRWRILVEDGPSRHRPDGVPHNVMHTWQITIDHLEQAHPLAHWILMVIVYYHNQNIPWTLIEAIGLWKLQEERQQRWSIDHELGQSRLDSDVDGDEVRLALSRLTQFSLIRERSDLNQDLQSFDIHKLVQDATRRAIWQQSSKGALQPSSRAAQTALWILSQLFPSGAYGTWDVCASLITHVLAVRQCLELADFEFEMCSLLSRAAGYLQRQGRTTESEEIYAKILKVREETSGRKHPDTISSMATLANTYYKQRRIEEAEKLAMKAFKLQKEVLGETHPETLSSMVRLSSIYYKQRRIDEAEKFAVQAIELGTKVLGEKHSGIAWAMESLRYIYYRQGRVLEAEKMAVQALDLYRERRGKKHPTTIAAMAGLAYIVYRQGRWSEAEGIYVEVLKMRNEVLGERHPETFISMASLASTYYRQGRLIEAEKLYRKVVELRREVLGDNHRKTIEVREILERSFPDG